jgi:hypothetical protein
LRRQIEYRRKWLPKKERRGGVMGLIQSLSARERWHFSAKSLMVPSRQSALKVAGYE